MIAVAVLLFAVFAAAAACVGIAILLTPTRPIVAFQPIVVPELVPVPTGTTAVVIFAGQSNMVGQGTGRLDDWIPNTLVYTNVLDQRYWQPLGPRTNDGGIGPDVEFARQWNVQKGTPLAIIKIAEGASGFETGEWSARDGRLYQELRTALGAIWDLGAPAQFVGACWYQGEHDAWSETARDAYYDRLSTFIRALREDTGSPSLPFVATLINCAAGYRYCNEVRAATSQLAVTLPGVYVVDANDLPLESDNVHLNDKGVRIIGSRMYTALHG